MLFIKVKTFVIKHNFLLPFFLGALMCSIWGGFINLMLFVGIMYLGSKLIKCFKDYNANNCSVA